MRSKNANDLKKWEHFRKARLIVQNKYKSFTETRNKIYLWCSNIKLIRILLKIKRDMKFKKREITISYLEVMSSNFTQRLWKKFAFSKG
jgi:hypothetical protein